MPNEIQSPYYDHNSSLEHVLADYTDPRLIDLLQSTGLIEDGPTTTYDQARVLKLMRAAYWHGATDMARDPKGVMEANDNVASEKKRRVDGSASAPG